MTGLDSACAAIEEIIEQGEGARGDWQPAHYGRFLGIWEEYQRLREQDPGFEPARPVIPAFTRQPFDIAEPQPLLTDPATCDVAELSASAMRSCCRCSPGSSPTPTRPTNSSACWSRPRSGDGRRDAAAWRGAHPDARRSPGIRAGRRARCSRCTTRWATSCRGGRRHGRCCPNGWPSCPAAAGTGPGEPMPRTRSPRRRRPPPPSPRSWPRTCQPNSARLTSTGPLPHEPVSSGVRSLERRPVMEGRPGSEGAHPVVAGVVLDLGEPQRLQDRRHVVAEPAAQPLLQAVPAADRVAGRAAPGLDRARPRPASARRRCPAAPSRRAPSASRAGRRCSAAGSAAGWCRPGRPGRAGRSPRRATPRTRTCRAAWSGSTDPRRFPIR